MSDTGKKPEWSEEGPGFASRVMSGVEGGHDGMLSQTPPDQPAPAPRTGGRRLSINDYVQGVLDHDLTTLARAITLVESNASAHLDTAQEVLRRLLPHTGNSIRIGISGVPGAGKSSFIETFGSMLCDQGHRVAVLAVDPSSSVTRGSILGDKTRMETLARNPNAFIRPSPSGGMLGGVARKSRETILVCEAAGFDVILVETMGVGQSEITVRSMVDFFLLVLITGAGDELQGIKKGIIEIADALLINKADGDNKLRAQTARTEYNRALHYLTSYTEGWRPKAYTCSAHTGEGIPDIWQMIGTFREQMGASGVFEKRRRAQTLDWMRAIVDEQLQALFFRHPDVKDRLPQVEQAVADGALPATAAAKSLIETFAGEKL